MCKKFKNFVKRQLYWEASLYLSPRFYSRWFVSLFSIFIWTKWWLKNYCIDFFHTFFVYIFGRASAWDHSHQKQENSLETRAALIEIFILCWNLPKHRGWLQKETLLSLKGISCLQAFFLLIWIKQTLIWFNLQRDITGNGLSNIKDTFVESLQLQMSVLHQSMSIFQSLRLVSQVHMTAGQNVKKKYLMCQIPIKMLKQHATSNSSLPSVKIYSLKGCWKTSER